MVDNSKYKRLGRAPRVMAGFIFAMVVLGSIGLVVTLVKGGFDSFWLPVIFMELIAGHISGSVFFTGYAPRYLLFAHRPLE